jgi:hypothetical protein
MNLILTLKIGPFIFEKIGPNLNVDILYFNKILILYHKKLNINFIIIIYKIFYYNLLNI